MDAHRPCPDSALLAAFLDGTLTGYERTAVVSHLAECPECRAVAATVVEFREVEAFDDLWERPTPPAPPEPLLVSGVTRWTREKTRAPALAIAAAAALVAVAVPLYLVLPRTANPQSPQQAVSTLIDVAEEQRPMVARLSGASVYAPPPSETRRSPANDRAHIQLITAASDVRSAYAHDYAAPSRRAIGVAALLTGDLDEAIATLAIAAAGAPDDARMANDLAAAYYERAVRANRPDDLPAALSAVERVLYREPANLEALFNRALIITELGLRAEAQAAWQAYIARDPQSPWTEEARARLSALPSLAARTDWVAVRDAFERSPDVERATTSVREHTSAAHDFIENVLLNRWLDAVKANEEGKAEATLSRMRLLADAFAQHVPDNIYRDALNALRAARARGPDAYAQAVAAHEAFAAGMRLMSEQQFQEAAALLARAHDELSGVESPWSIRAQIEVAMTRYYAMQFAAAAQLLPPLKDRAGKESYAMLQGRAAWVQGLAAFGLNNFAAARVAYEELLAVAAASGDADAWLWACGLLANLHDMLGDAARAWRYRIDAGSRLHEAVRQSTRSALLASAAGDAATGGYHDAALLLQALLLSSAAPSPNLEAQVRAQRARSLAALRRTAEAEREWSKAQERLALVADETSRLRVEGDVRLAEAEVFLETNTARAVAAVERALSLPVTQRDSLRRARLYLQLAEAHLSGERLARADDAIAAAVEALERYRAIPSAEFTIRASDNVWNAYTRAAEIAMRRGDVRRAFAYNERGRVRTADERRTWGAETATLEDVQEALGDGTALCVLTQFEQQLQIWVVRRDGMTSHAVSMTATRAAGLVAAHLEEMLAERPTPAMSAELFDATLRPVVHTLKGVRNVIVVADAPYNRIGFAGLWDARRQRFVVEDHGIVLAPSATAFAWASRRHAAQPIRERRASVIRGPQGNSVRPDGALSDSLRAAYGSQRLQQPSRVTASTFSQTVGTADVVHVEAMLVPNDQYPALSRVIVDEESGHKYSGAVYARRIADGPVRAQLVTFERMSHVAVNSHGDGSLGFARALIAAGVPAVVSPVTQISEVSVEQTWLDFHKHYAAGGTAVESLRRAQLAALNESDRRPGSWATLTVFGSAQ